jgi:hypothetical protein
MLMFPCTIVNHGVSCYVENQMQYDYFLSLFLGYEMSGGRWGCVTGAAEVFSCSQLQSRRAVVNACYRKN